MGGGRIPLLWRVALVALALACVGRDACAEQTLEDGVKATFLFRFASFAEWPASAFDDPSAPFVICVAGDRALTPLVEQSATDQRVAGRRVTVRAVEGASTYAGCHILYLALPPQAAREALAATEEHAVLTVTDSRYGSPRGIIHFALSGGRVRFHIDRRAASRNGLSLNARLLNIALTVDGTPR